MRVVFSTAAREDLRGIGRYIAADNPARARTFVAELIDKARSIARMPEGYPVVHRYAHLGIRRRRHDAYIIFYRLESEQVVVIHVLHGARDYDALLTPEA